MFSTLVPFDEGIAVESDRRAESYYGLRQQVTVVARELFGGDCVCPLQGNVYKA